MRLVVALIALFIPALASAACEGSDLRETLTSAERSRIETFRAETPYAAGNRWVARRGNQEIQIVGTMHLDDPRWEPIVDRMRPFIENAEVLLVEMTDDEQARMKREMTRNPSHMFIEDGPTLPDRMSETEWERLSRAMRDRGMPKFMVAKTQPWFLSLILGVPACAIVQGEAAQNGLDKRLVSMARESGVPQAGLEEFEMLFALLANQPIDDQMRLLLASLPMAEQADDQFATVAAQYFDEDIAGAWAMADVIAKRSPDLEDGDVDAIMADMRDRLLDRRNTAWMDVILSREENRIVIAVGALHLMGDKGLLGNLEKAGYSVDRLPF